MKKFWVGILISVLIIGVSSCSSKKNLINNELHEISAKKLIREVENNNFEFETIQAKMSVDVESPDMNITLKGQLRMEKDSVVWVSLSLPMGLEVARAMITSDSVFFLNKTQKQYLKTSIDTLSKLLPFANLQLVQSILVGNDMYIRNGDKYDVTTSNGLYNLMITNQLKKEIKQKNFIVKGVARNLSITPDIFKISDYQINEVTDETKNIKMKFSDFQLVGENYLPTEIDVTLNTGVVFEVSVTYSNVILNEPQEYKFSIPKKYTPMK